MPPISGTGRSRQPPSIRRAPAWHARALMIALEPIAESAPHASRRHLTGGAAETRRLPGYVTVGVIQRYARGLTTPELEKYHMYAEL